VDLVLNLRVHRLLLAFELVGSHVHLVVVEFLREAALLREVEVPEGVREAGEGEGPILLDTEVGHLAQVVFGFAEPLQQQMRLLEVAQHALLLLTLLDLHEFAFGQDLRELDA